MQELSDKKIKEICKREPECYCPEIHLIRLEIANTPEYIRRIFMQLGKEELKFVIKNCMNIDKEVKELLIKDIEGGEC